MTIQKNDEKIIGIFPRKIDEENTTNTDIPKKSEKDEFVGFFPMDDYNELNSNCQNIVKEAENDYFNQYLLAVNLIEGKNVILQFSQASFQDIVQIIQSKTKSKTQVILMIFSLINKESFQHLIDEWSANKKDIKLNDIVIILVGVDSENWDNETPDFVTQKEIKIFAQRIGAYKAIKCSYATDSKIEYLKDQITKSIISKK